MTRDQTLDVCLNHRITSGITFRPKDDKSWLWSAQDFSDGVGKTETFLIRFRDAETSKAFMRVVLENQVNKFSYILLLHDMHHFFIIISGWTNRS